MNKSQAYNAEFYERQREASFRSAEVVLPTLMRLVSFSSAVDVGCGVGTWLRALIERGVSDVLGIDGDYVSRAALQIPEDRFLPRDIRLPLALDRRFDLAMSLEVAEHLPAECAAALVRSLVGMAPVILFSAAIPFQGGTNHVNEQWPEYWANLFRSHGYAPIDCIRPDIWNDPRVEWWYAQNTLLYANEEGMARNPALVEFCTRTSLVPLCVVHPKNYLRIADAASPSLRRSMILTAAASKNAFLRRLKKAH